MELLKLNIQRFASSNSYSITSAYETDASIDSNTSYVYITSTVTTNSGTYNTTGNAYATITATVGGQTYSSGNMYYSIKKSSSYSFSVKLGPFTHNDDGSLGSVSVTSYCRVTNSVTFNTSTSVSMQTIPRATSCPNISGTIGNQYAIQISPASSSFSHNLAWSFGGYSGNISFGGGTTTAYWTPSLDLHNAITSSKSGTGSLTLTTYTGSTTIGSKTGSLTLYANEAACTPSINGSVVDSNSITTSLTGDNTKFVKYKSDAKFTLTTETKYNASVSSILINGVQYSSTTPTISGVQTSVFTLKITDSRGYSYEKTIGNASNLINFIPLTLSGNIVRNKPTDNKVKLDYSGNYFNGYFNDTNKNELTVSYRYKEQDSETYSSWLVLTPTITNNTYNGTLTTNADFDYQKSYNFEIKVQDKYNNDTNSNSIVYKQTILEGIPVYWWNKTSFNINGELNATSLGSTILNTIYPVGSIYMSFNSTSPAELFGGTWSRIPTGRVLISAGGGINPIVEDNNYTGRGSFTGGVDWFLVGEKGGEVDHTLTVSEMPSHTHDVKFDQIWGTSGGTTSLGTNSGGPYTGTTFVYSTGGDQAHNNVQPYISVYMWKRTA